MEYISTDTLFGGENSEDLLSFSGKFQTTVCTVQVALLARKLEVLIGTRKDTYKMMESKLFQKNRYNSLV